MENNNNGNKGVFPGTPVPSQGSIQTGPPVVGNPKVTAIQPAGHAAGASAPNLSHHETPNNNLVETEGNIEAATQDGAVTYIKLETTNTEQQISGIIEVDLISFRDRGQESRFLSINTTGSDAEGNSSTTSININNEADFNRFKKFISELNWND